MEAQRWPRKPTWTLKSDLGREVGGQKLIQKANLEVQAAKGANLDAQRPPRRRTWRPKGALGSQLGRQKAIQDANLEPKWSQKGAQKEPRGSKNEAQEPT